VKRAYELILGRTPDSGGLANYLAQVRAGVHKAQIVAELALSPEGNARQAALPGLRDIVSVHRKRAPSLWRRLFRNRTSAAVEPTERQLRALDNRLYLLERNLSAQAKQLADLATLVQSGLTSPNGPIQNSIGPKNDSMPVGRFLSHLSPGVERTFTELKAAIAMKRVC